jgi:2-polyprenyl-3-methyl-5-hydroxy-6-metoxy-1,4-benzoquinol methylase
MVSERELAGIAHEYLTPTDDRVVDRRLVDMIADFVVPRLPGESVLELGVGDQIWTPKLVKHFATVTTLEGDDELLAVMSRTMAAIPASSWQGVRSLFEEYFPAQRFDVVLATYVLEHVDDPGLILRRAREHWLRPGGRIAVCVPHALSLHRRLAVAMGMIATPSERGETDRRMGHLRCLTHQEMEELLVENGFRVVERRGLICKPFPNAMLARCTDAQLRGLFDLGLELPIEYGGALYFQAEAV